MQNRFLLGGCTLSVTMYWSVYAAQGQVFESIRELPFTPVTVNDTGQVVGTMGGDAVLWENGVTTNLGMLGGTSSMAVDINEVGQVAGTITQAKGNTEAFIWTSGVMTGLGTLGGCCSEAVAINDSGQVIGTSENATGNLEAFIWENGVMTGLGTLSVCCSEAVAINNSGQVVGNLKSISNETEAFLWENGVMTGLGTLGGTGSSAVDVNEAGQITGISQVSPNLGSSVFLWENGVMTGVGGSPSIDSSSHVKDMNNSGVMVGYINGWGGSSPASNCDRSAIWFHTTTWRILIQCFDSGVGFGSSSHANSINDNGHEVGFNASWPDSGVGAVLWTTTGFASNTTQLFSLLPQNTNWDSLANAHKITNSGYILGTGLLSASNSSTTPFILKLIDCGGSATGTDCNGNGNPDGCDIDEGTSFDCNGNGIPDACDIADGTSFDCNNNGIPEECDPFTDCNGNSISDSCDIASGVSQDSNANGIPDECDNAPENNTCAQANSILAGNNVIININALTLGDPESCGNLESDVWYSFTTATSCYLTASICFATFDTELALYNSTCPSGPDQALACSDDACGTGSTFTLAVNPGIYYIRIGGKNNEQGVGVLFFDSSPTAPCWADVTPGGGDGVVDMKDLVVVLNGFGSCPAFPLECDADITPPGGNGVVNIDDLVAVLNGFGDCP